MAASPNIKVFFSEAQNRYDFFLHPCWKRPRHDVADMPILEHVSEELRGDRSYIGAGFVPEHETFELHEWASETRVRRVDLARVYSNPCNLERDPLVASIGTLSAKANHRIKAPASNGAHAVVTAEHAGLARVTDVRPLVNQRVQWSSPRHHSPALRNRSRT
jgi:hypothetical protein